jgi:hypothetical protein
MLYRQHPVFVKIKKSSQNIRFSRPRALRTGSGNALSVGFEIAITVKKPLESEKGRFLFHKL